MISKRALPASRFPAVFAVLASSSPLESAVSAAPFAEEGQAAVPPEEAYVPGDGFEVARQAADSARDGCLVGLQEDDFRDGSPPVIGSADWAEDGLVLPPDDSVRADCLVDSAEDGSVLQQEDGSPPADCSADSVADGSVPQQSDDSLLAGC